MNGNEKTLLRHIATVDFALTETVLYLDAYPESRPALSYYHRLIAQKEALVKEYESKYGPLTAAGNRSKTAWQWTMAPWPWEADAN